MRGVRLLIALGAWLALAAPAAATDYQVAFGGMLGRAYAPKDLSIVAGDTVTFNGTFSDHPLVWDSGTPGVTNSGSTKQFSFPRPGTYTYYCQLHVNTDNMRGVIRVPDQHPAYVSFSASPAQPAAGQPVTFTYTGSGDPDGSLVRWEWDLDGDGSFETATPGGSATTTYASARTVTVLMRAVDDSGEPSTVASQAVTVVAAGSGSGAGSGASSTGDTTAPRATLVKLRGLKLTFRSSERASATATLRARGKTIARGSAKAKSGAIAIRLRLTKSGRSLLPRGHKLRAKLALTLRDASGNRTTVTRQLTVTRA
jgi:plastocyanin